MDNPAEEAGAVSHVHDVGGVAAAAEETVEVATAVRAKSIVNPPIFPATLRWKNAMGSWSCIPTDTAFCAAKTIITLVNEATRSYRGR
jgi:hypothetical protein